jgi:putative Holliday junction resolvase
MSVESGQGSRGEDERSPGGPGTRRLCLDLGTVRIGLALSDPLGITATPLPSLARRGDAADLAALAEAVTAHGVGELVIGLPRNMDGSTGPAAREAERFAEAARRSLGLPVSLYDERLTTRAAEAALAEAGLRGRKRRARVDGVAAALILQSYLARRRVPERGSPGDPD